MAPESSRTGAGPTNGQETARILQEEVDDASRRVDEDDRAHGRRRADCARRSDSGPGGQGGEFVYEGVSLRHDEQRPDDPEPDRRGVEANSHQRIRIVPDLPGRDAAEAPGGSALGEELHQLPGEDRAGIGLTTAWREAVGG